MNDKQIYNRLWRDWVLPYKSRLIGALCLMVGVAATGGAYPAVIQHVFDALSGGEAWLPISPALYIPAMIMCLACLKAVSMFFQVLAVNSLALRVTTDIQKAMARYLVDADLAFVTGEPAGVFISRIMNDLNLLREAIIRLANNLVRDALTVIVMVCLMFWFSWLLSLMVLAVYPLAMKPIISIGRRQRKASGALQEHLESVTSLLGETLQGVRMVKAYQLEDTEKERTHSAFETLYKELIGLFSGRARIDPILEALGGVAVAGVIGVAAWQVSSGKMGIGDVAGFITALLMLVQPVRALGTLTAVIQEGMAAGGRIFGLLDRENQIIDKLNAPALSAVTGHVQFNDVSFSYGDGGTVLDKVSFEVLPGQTVALVGASGAGKSSIISLLPRFYDLDSGSITVDGQDISGVSLKTLRQHIGLVSQDAILFDMSIADNIRFGRLDASQADIEQAAKIAAADSFIRQLEGGYEMRVGSNGNRLSGGQRQRIAIARALLKDAPLLLLDEATSALDAEAETQIQAALSRLSEGRTTIVIAHRLSTIRDADHIIVMDNGRIVERGTHLSLISQKGHYAHLCALQNIST